MTKRVRSLAFASPAAGSLTALALLLLTIGIGPSVAAARDSCVDCHRNPDFLVTHPKLYAYYRDWERSIHRQEDVSCADCHGGNPEVADKRGAHGVGPLGEAGETSAVNFKNVPETCGDCHDEVREGYLRSPHFEHLTKKGEEHQGPNCVTCHGSMSTGILDVTTVEATCSQCHNQESDNHPEIPDKARVVLNKFLSMDRFYRYVSIRVDPVKAKPFFKDVDERMHRLSILWHTFDIEKIETETQAVLDVFKRKRDEIRRQRKPKGPEEPTAEVSSRDGGGGP